MRHLPHFPHKYQCFIISGTSAPVLWSNIINKYFQGILELVGKWFLCTEFYVTNHLRLTLSPSQAHSKQAKSMAGKVYIGLILVLFFLKSQNKCCSNQKVFSLQDDIRTEQVPVLSYIGLYTISIYQYIYTIRIYQCCQYHDNTFQEPAKEQMLIAMFLPIAIMVYVPLGEHPVLCILWEANYQYRKHEACSRRDDDFPDGYDGVFDAGELYTQNNPITYYVSFVGCYV